MPKPHPVTVPLMGRFLIKDAQAVGIERAILLWHFRREFSSMKGKLIVTSYAELHECHPYIRVGRIRKRINELVDMGLLKRSALEGWFIWADDECFYTPISAPDLEARGDRLVG